MDILIVFSTLLNIGAIIVFMQLYKKFKLRKDQEIIDLHNSMEVFVENLEKENEELFQKLTDYIKVKERELYKRISTIEGEVSLKNEPLDSPLITTSSDAIVKDSTSQFQRDDEKVLTLHKQGFSPKQIAKVLKMENGKVELIINMLEKKKSHQKENGVPKLAD